MRKSLIVLLAAGLVVAACSEAEPESSTPDPSTDESTGESGPANSVVEGFAGEEWFMGIVPDEPVAADPSLEPIQIGMINQEDTPLGSFPELRRATEGTVEFINTELGGVGGRPIELTTCVVSFNVEQSQACAQTMVQKDVVALSGGIDVVSDTGSIPVLEQNGIPQVGGIPANLAEQKSDVTFYFSGGVTGALAAFMADAAENDAEKVVIGYGEFNAFEESAREYAVPVGESLGMTVDLAPFNIAATDFLPILTGIADSDPDAIIMAVAGSSCVPLMETYADLQIEAQLYLVGACAADEIVEAAGENVDGIVFNSEGPVEVGDTEGDIYNEINARYADGEGSGSGTLGVRSMMNLYALLDELGPDGVSREAVTGLIRQAVDRPSFWGYPYTCDGEQIAGLPSLCAPQQTLFTAVGPADFEQRGPAFIDTVALFEAAL
ncbi:MAG TPA: ABC transporter substrate-binding protein [Acidimicrobiales bacterium]|nr:ABC transporter substrate-binding protein [Acidimicrobiales bacterium]